MRVLVAQVIVGEPWGEGMPDTLKRGELPPVLPSWKRSDAVSCCGRQLVYEHRRQALHCTGNAN